jgi:predicted AlkP superfamily phosphohydrolase/phosphomutase
MVFMQLDIAQHLFWHEMETGNSPRGDVIERLYRRADAFLGKVLSVLDRDTTLVVVSDHGAGPLKKTVSINRWLLQEGYLVPRRQRMLKRAFDEMLREALTLLNMHFAKWIKTRFKKSFAGVRGKAESHLVTAQINWTKTEAFTLGEYGGIYVNLQGREDQGTVPPEEYDQLRDEIAAKLLNLRDPDTGEAVIQHVYRREEIYSGAYVEGAPDLILDWDYAYDCRERVRGHKDVFESKATYIPFADYVKTGVHRRHGIFLMYGWPARPGRVEGARLMDIAPTLLHLLGIPVPDDMDGHVLTDALEPDWLAQHPISLQTAESDAGAGQASSYSENEEAQIMERLRAVGYLD